MHVHSCAPQRVVSVLSILTARCHMLDPAAQLHLSRGFWSCISGNLLLSRSAQGLACTPWAEPSLRCGWVGKMKLSSRNHVNWEQEIVQNIVQKWNVVCTHFLNTVCTVPVGYAAPSCLSNHKECIEINTHRKHMRCNRYISDCVIVVSDNTYLFQYSFILS